MKATITNSTITNPTIILDMVNLNLSDPAAFAVAMRIIGRRSQLRAKQPLSKPAPSRASVHCRRQFDEIADAAAYTWFLVAKAVAPQYVARDARKTVKRVYKLWCHKLAKKIIATAEPLKSTAMAATMAT